jgi:uncharacterized protein YjbI with pentapeptide repeats
MKQTLAKLWHKSYEFIDRHLSTIIVILVALALLGTPLWIWLDYVTGWTGLGAYENPNYAEQPRFLWGKSVWDWLDLLLVPVVLAVAGLLFNRAERRAERELAADRAQQAALQDYLATMTELLLEKGLRESAVRSEIRDIARAHTLATLRVLDGARKGLLLQFLYETALLEGDDQGETIVYLRDADLSGADLRLVGMTAPGLLGVNLNGADLSLAYLPDAVLTAAKLVDADLRKTILERGHLSWADLTRADLRNAKLVDAKLEGTTLTRAKLKGADLSRVKLSEYTTLPDGTKWTPDTDMTCFTDRP